MPIKKCRLSQSGRKITELFVGFKKLGTVFETNKRKRLKNPKSGKIVLAEVSACVMCG